MKKLEDISAIEHVSEKSKISKHSKKSKRKEKVEEPSFDSNMFKNPNKDKEEVYQDEGLVDASKSKMSVTKNT